MDVSSYMKSLYRLRALRPRILYPGHGPHVREGIELLNRYILHRTSREQQVQKVLAERAESASFTTREIVDRLYTDMTTEKVRMALENVQRILMKLGKDGKAQPLRLVPRSRDRARISLALATETRIAGPADTPSLRSTRETPTRSGHRTRSLGICPWVTSCRRDYGGHLLTRIRHKQSRRARMTTLRQRSSDGKRRETMCGMI
jgi:hypothetical protein